MNTLFRIAAVICIYVNVSTARADTFATGAEAYDGGRYAEAFTAWKALADNGEVRAQVAIAGMYRFGEGRAVNLRAAAQWYRRAADAGDPIAQLNYAAMLENGTGIARNVVAARYWYDLAAQQGNAWARAQLDRLKDAGAN